MHIINVQFRVMELQQNQYLNLYYIMIMNNTLDKLFHNRKIGKGNKTPFIKLVRDARKDLNQDKKARLSPEKNKIH